MQHRSCKRGGFAATTARAGISALVPQADREVMSTTPAANLFLFFRVCSDVAANGNPQPGRVTIESSNLRDESETVGVVSERS